MSGSTTPAKPAKAMSSRLLTMKFMQRAAASSPLSSPSTPDQPSAKRQRTDSVASPLSAFDVNALADQKAVEIALATEEAKRQIALDKQALEAGDTRWVLNFEQSGRQGSAAGRGSLRVQQASFAAIDRGAVAAPRVVYEEEESLDQPVRAGRRSFGKFNRKLEKLQDPDASSDSDSEEDEDEAEAEESDFDEDDPTSQLVKTIRDDAARELKAQRKAKRKAEKAELLRLAEKRKKKEVKLNKLTSISGGSGGSKGASKGPCHNCGEMGHFIAECSKGKRGRAYNDGGDGQRFSKKSRKSG